MSFCLREAVISFLLMESASHQEQICLYILFGLFYGITLSTAEVTALLGSLHSGLQAYIYWGVLGNDLRCIHRTSRSPFFFKFSCFVRYCLFVILPEV